MNGIARRKSAIDEYVKTGDKSQVLAYNRARAKENPTWTIRGVKKSARRISHSDLRGAKNRAKKARNAR